MYFQCKLQSCGVNPNRYTIIKTTNVFATAYVPLQSCSHNKDCDYESQTYRKNQQHHFYCLLKSWFNTSQQISRDSLNLIFSLFFNLPPTRGILPSSAERPASAGLRWSLLLISPTHPPTHHPRESTTNALQKLDVQTRSIVHVFKLQK